MSKVTYNLTLTPHTPYTSATWLPIPPDNHQHPFTVDRIGFKDVTRPYHGGQLDKLILTFNLKGF
jgi:hypothetical protein